MDARGLVVLLLLLLVAIFERARLSAPPMLYHSQSGAAKPLIDMTPSLHRAVCPPLWASWRAPVGPAVQLVPFLISGALDLCCRRTPWTSRTDIETPDGELLELCATPPLNASSPTVLFLHGACCSADDLPGRSLVRAARDAGFHCAAYNRRGHHSARSGALAARAAASARCDPVGESDDLSLVVNALRTARPASPLLLMGVSTGATLLLRYLGETGQTAPIAASVAVAPGLDLPASCAAAAPIYGGVLRRRMQHFYGWRQRHHPGLSARSGFRAFLRATTAAEALGAVHVPANRPSADAYLSERDPRRVAAGVAVPTLLLTAQDDPVFKYGPNIEPQLGLFRGGCGAEDGAGTGALALAVTRSGSHCPFYEGLLYPSSWATRTMLEWFHAALHRPYVLPAAGSSA